MKKQLYNFDGNNKEVVLKAVSEDASVFCHPEEIFISPELREDEDVVMAALNAKVKTTGPVLKHTGPKIKENRELALACIKANPLSIKQVSEKLNNDESFIHDAIVTNPKVLVYKKDYELDKDLFERIYNENFEGLKYLKMKQIVKGMQELGFNISESYSIKPEHIDMGRKAKENFNRLKKWENIESIGDFIKFSEGISSPCINEHTKEVVLRCLAKTSRNKVVTEKLQNDVLDQNLQSAKKGTEDLVKEIEHKKEVLQGLKDMLEERKRLEEESRQLDEQISALVDMLDKGNSNDNPQNGPQFVKA